MRPAEVLAHRSGPFALFSLHLDLKKLPLRGRHVAPSRLPILPCAPRSADERTGCGLREARTVAGFLDG